MGKHGIRRRLLRLVPGLLLGLGLAALAAWADRATSTDAFCASCHFHPHVEKQWIRSHHYDNPRGIVVHCVECHLPPEGIGRYLAKIRFGFRDLYGKLFKDPARVDWKERGRLEHAQTYVFKEACVRCHTNPFPLGMSEKGDEAHLYYTRKAEALRCIACHLQTGHFDPGAEQGPAFSLAGSAGEKDREVFTAPAKVERFENFTERIPGTPVSFDMIAVPGGEFYMGSPADEPFRDGDEGPVRRVRVSPFWMGRTEVTWEMYEAFYRATAAQGRTDTRSPGGGGVDGVTGATPPYGNPDQGWGRGTRPAITMTHHAATVFCRWLSLVTGRKYRLPTEAEWEYACRGGTQGPYFFPGSPRAFSRRTLWNRIFGPKREGISKYVIYRENSGGRTAEPEGIEPNPFGLVNMVGNVWEFCADWYAPDAYARSPEGGTIVDPRGPAEGKEHVIRGGCFKSDAAEVRCASRASTDSQAWRLTDPQVPKSRWWYSDCVTVGFRVVCEYEGEDRGS